MPADRDLAPAVALLEAPLLLEHVLRGRKAAASGARSVERVARPGVCLVGEDALGQLDDLLARRLGRRMS